AGLPYPARRELLEWHHLVGAQSRAWSALSEAERELALADSPIASGLPAPVTELIELEARLGDVLTTLHHQELARVQAALREVDAWLRARPARADA
ncbi:MAG TPA: hypothetical protein VGB85_05065, partial [Nannocystis sp.]